MSRYHHGYRLAEGTDLFEFCAEVRTKLNPVRDDLDMRMLTTSAVRIYDAQTFVATSPQRDMSAWSSAYYEFAERQRKEDPSRRFHDPHRFEFSVAPDPLTGRLHVLIYCDRKDLRVAFEGLDAVSEYGYWDNTDKLEGVTDQEWSEREAAWDRIKPAFEPDTNAMLSFVLRPDWDMNFDIMRLQGAAEEAVAATLAEEFEPAERALYVAMSLISGQYDKAEFAASPFQVVSRIKRSEQTRELAEHIEALLTPLTLTHLRAQLSERASDLVADLEGRAAGAVAHIRGSVGA
jgi:hypothetical protein